VYTAKFCAVLDVDNCQKVALGRWNTILSVSTHFLLAQFCIATDDRTQHQNCFIASSDFRRSDLSMTQPAHSQKADLADLKHKSVRVGASSGDTGTGEAHKEHSYGQILKSSSIIGGAQGINYLISMVRFKLVAVLLGPSGVGLVGLYVSATGLVSTVAGVGIGTSGVREVAEASGGGNAEKIARTIKTLRRACWATGILGWLLCASLSYPLSLWTFGSGERAWAIAILGINMLLGDISGGQNALLQGTRRIGEIARSNVSSAVIGTIVAVALYSWLGQKGIVPVLIISAAVNLGCSWWFARRVQTIHVVQSWRETIVNSRRLVGLGLAFMYSALVVAVVGLAIRAMIARRLGLEAAGIYQAVWSISGMFAGFILGAMGTDFYPRLTAVAHDHDHLIRLVNEQTEIGVLLALPGLLATLAFAPWVMHIFYSAKFVSGATLLPWFVLGVLGQVISWPMGYVLSAKGASGWLSMYSTMDGTVNLILVMLLLGKMGLVGCGVAFAILNLFHVGAIMLLMKHLIGFRWTAHTVCLLLCGTGLIGAAYLSVWLLPPVWAVVCNLFLLVATAIFSLRGIIRRLGADHRIVVKLMRLQGFKWLAA
jgi:antigen flippase